MPEQALKDRALGKSQLHQIAELVGASWEGFEQSGFISAAVGSGFEKAGILGRIRVVSESLASHLPPSFSTSTNILLRALRLSPGPTSLFGDFVYAPFSDFVALTGCCPEHLDRSLAALREMTPYYSSELALRPFLAAFPDETLNCVEQWPTDPREQVRRLASEGTRPLLPWAPKVQLPANRTLRLLDELKADSSQFVLRSVGNHLDDIARQNPGLALHTLAAWTANGWRGPGTRLVMRQATRSLLRAGDVRVFELLGMRAPLAISQFDAGLSSCETAIGDPLTLTLHGQTSTNERLYIDVELMFPSATTGKQSRRVFKVKVLEAKACRPFQVKYSVRTSSTATRTVRPGRCSLAVRVNGECRRVLNFTLVE